MLTDKEYEAFEGLEESYEYFDKKLQELAPTCHFTKMNYEQGDEYGEQWWECLHCGHTKEI